MVLAGGRGTRLEEETGIKPKPMVEIGGLPILWHIMKHYAHYGFNEFFIALGYRADVIKRYFLHYYTLSGNFTIDLNSGDVVSHSTPPEDWRIHLIDTGMKTNTGGRLLRLRRELEGGTFMVTYGDAVSNVDLHAVLEFHRSHGRIVTLTAVRPPARFGEIKLSSDRVVDFAEKPETGDGWVNGGFLVLEPAFFDYLKGDDTRLDVLGKVAEDGQLAAFQHTGYWQCMDTIRDKWRLEEDWATGQPPWRVWD